MNEMYSLDLDRYGPPLEPPDDYYFLPRLAEQEELTDDE
jgi:hypothetical protein